MKLWVALKGWVQVCPDGKSVNGLVLASSPVKTGCVNRADVETPLIVRTL